MQTAITRLVLLPGMDGTGELFHPFLHALPDGFSAGPVAYPTGKVLSLSEHLALIHSHCPESEPYALIAESFSTPIAIRSAASNPANLKCLILCAGFAVSPIQGWRRTLASILSPFVFHLPLPAPVIRRWLTGSDASPELVEAVRIAVAKVRPAILTARLRLVLTTNVQEELMGIPVPILYLKAARDRVVGAANLERIRELRPRISEETIDGPHLILQRRPAEAASAILQYLENLR